MDLKKKVAEQDKSLRHLKTHTRRLVESLNLAIKVQENMADRINSLEKEIIELCKQKR